MRRGRRRGGGKTYWWGAGVGGLRGREVWVHGLVVVERRWRGLGLVCAVPRVILEPLNFFSKVDDSAYCHGFGRKQQWR